MPIPFAAESKEGSPSKIKNFSQMRWIYFHRIYSGNGRNTSCVLVVVNRMLLALIILPLKIYFPQKMCPQWRIYVMLVAIVLIWIAFSPDEPRLCYAIKKTCNRGCFWNVYTVSILSRGGLRCLTQNATIKKCPKNKACHVFFPHVLINECF